MFVWFDLLSGFVCVCVCGCVCVWRILMCGLMVMCVLCGFVIVFFMIVGVFCCCVDFDVVRCVVLWCLNSRWFYVFDSLFFSEFWWWV